MPGTTTLPSAHCVPYGSCWNGKVADVTPGFAVPSRCGLQCVRHVRHAHTRCKPHQPPRLTRDGVGCHRQEAARQRVSAGDRDHTQRQVSIPPQGCQQAGLKIRCVRLLCCGRGVHCSYAGLSGRCLTTFHFPRFYVC